MRNIQSALILYLFMVSILSCKNNDSVSVAKKDAITIKQEEQISLSNITISVPAGWELEQPDNSMRVLQFANTETPEHKLVVFYFGQQEMKQPNIDRWKSQFSILDKSEELVLDKSELTALKLLGTFKKKPFPMAQEFIEVPDYGMLAAIVPSKNGPYYFKLVAPKKFIAKQQSIFIEMLNSYAIQ